MQVIPAIDIRDGKCVRLLQGQAERQTVYGDDPVAMAQRWVEAGASMLHVVDLDGAFAGRPQNFAVIERMVRAMPVPLQLGGGLRDLEAIETVLGAGVSRVILGTSVLEHWDMLTEATERYPGQVCVGIDSRQGKVAIRGWQDVSEIDTLSLMRRVDTVGVAAIVYTDIARDGMLAGPNLDGIAEVARQVQTPLIASGGVARLDDLRRLAALESLGVTAVIVGKALYEGRLEYRQAMAVAAGG